MISRFGVHHQPKPMGWFFIATPPTLRVIRFCD